MNRTMRLTAMLCALMVPGSLLLTCGAATALAQDEDHFSSFDAATVAADADSASGDVPAAQADSGDHAFMLVCSALVLMMTGPGLAMFYCGLVRKKNVLSVMMQCFFLMGLMTVLWGIYGYSLSFGEDPWIVGNTQNLFMKGVQPEFNTARNEVAWPMEGSIPKLTHMTFQGMFFIITPALICGAFAERMKFSTMVVFSVLWGTLVYCPLCNWVWGGGWLAYGEEGALFGGALDFAGGTVVHISSGISALICALLLGRRLGFGTEPMPPHNLTYTMIGAALLWVGWFGFNAGSALNSSSLAASAFVATHFAAAAGTISWAGAEWLLRGKPTLLGACSGAVAGLVCVTPAAGFVQPMSAIFFGLVAGVVCYFACTALKNKLGYDDSLDVFGIHGLGGTVGAVLTGLFATRAVFGGPDNPERLGLLEHGDIMLGQVAAVAVTWIFAAIVTFVLLKVLDVTMGLRVSQQDEIQGLDLSQHGEEGYIGFV